MMPDSLADSNSIDGFVECFFHPGTRIEWGGYGRGGTFPWVQVDKQRNPAALIVFQGLVSKEQLGFLLENLCNEWYNKIITMFVPCFQAMFDVFLSGFCRGCQAMLGAFVGLGGTSFNTWNETLTLIGLLVNVSQPVFVGHGAGGLMAKALATQFDRMGVAFEAPNLVTSVLDQRVGRGSDRKTVLVNVDSADSLFALAEDGATENLRVPTLGRSWFGGSNPYEMFSRLAAARVSDDTFDHLCDGAVRLERYKQFFALWGRDRFT
jgi:hypothetical protein